MKTRKRTVAQETLLSAVARKLGHAAGRLTRTTQELTEALSALPENISANVRAGANIVEPADRSRRPIRRATKRMSRAVRAQRTKVAAAVAKKHKPSKIKSLRHRPAA
jgi:hypothetical protein